MITFSTFIQNLLPWAKKKSFSFFSKIEVVTQFPLFHSLLLFFWLFNHKAVFINFRTIKVMKMLDCRAFRYDALGDEKLYFLATSIKCTFKNVLLKTTRVFFIQIRSSTGYLHSQAEIGADP